MIVGLGYRARSGKDTVADYLCHTHGFYKQPFAKNLKAAARDIFGLSHSQVYGARKETLDSFWQETPRSILQRFGTDCVRKGFRDDVWIKSAFRSIEGTRLLGYTNWVIPDVRFPNEADAIKEAGGILIRIDRPDEAAYAEVATKKHESETAMEGYGSWDYVIPNDGPLEDLYTQAREILDDAL